MRMLATLTIAALFFNGGGYAQAQYSSGGTTTSGGAGAMAMGTPAMTGKLGDEVFLMDASKMTLYTYDGDSPGISACYETCAQNWPPLLAASGTDLQAGYSLINRTDGTMQVAYEGQPLYLWVKDSRPGEMSGDGVGGVWHVARP